MRLVAALGGNALLQRGEKPAASIQRHHVEDAVAQLALVARDNELIVTHGNGPQVGLLAVESANDPLLAEPYPLDVIGAQTQGMIGYWLLQAFKNALPVRPVVALVTQTVVDPADPAFLHPTKKARPVVWPPRRAGRSPKTARAGGASSPRPIPWSSSSPP